MIQLISKTQQENVKVVIGIHKYFSGIFPSQDLKEFFALKKDSSEF